MTYTHQIRVWDDAASETFFLTESGRVYYADERPARDRAHSVGMAVWSAALDTDNAEELAEIARTEWADGYDGNPANIRAEVTAL